MRIVKLSWVSLCAVMLAACGVGPERREHAPAPAPIAVVPPAPSPLLPRPEVMRLASAAFDCGQRRGEIYRAVLTVIDYSLPSTEPRLWVIDMATGRLLHHELVAHGRNSGEDIPTSFSNIQDSKQSSLGLFRAEETYSGKHGYSLRMAGLEPGINDNARDRAIVMHGADYVSDDFIAEHGRLGRSWGCPALPREVSGDVIDAIRNGGAVFAYYPDEDWLRSSRYLNCATTGLAAQ